MPKGPPPVGSSPAAGDSQAGIGSAAVSGSGRTFLLFPTQARLNPRTLSRVNFSVITSLLHPKHLTGNGNWKVIQIKLFFWQALKMGFESPTRAAKLQRPQWQRITNPLPCIPVGHWWKKSLKHKSSRVITSSREKKLAIIVRLTCLQNKSLMLTSISQGTLLCSMLAVP